MPGPNFDDVILINKDNGCLFPRGPLQLATGETPLRVDVWIFQKRIDGTQTACMAFQDTFSPGTTVWATLGHPVHIGGPFLPGPAVGMALLVYEEADKSIAVYQWAEAILLE